MSLAVNEQHRLGEWREKPTPPAPLRVLAAVVSYAFHPVFVPVYIVVFILYLHPFLFAGYSGWEKSIALAQAFVMFTFFPLVTVLLLRAVKFVDSIFLRTQKDRIIPLVATGIWYFWIWHVWRNLPDRPTEAVMLPLGVWIAASLAILANIYLKISLHTIAMGILLCYCGYLALRTPDIGLYLCIAVFIAGLVTTARLLISDHTQKEIYLGLLLGFGSQCIAVVAMS
ncbi:MAG TPA: hypothetical protein VEB63_03960 [Chitinophagaceae bacterium]|nr:hypothetical protein [Chitinophagaceae bacterium]